ncbi:MAG: Na+/H+ antiporter subunit E [Hymenobacteraceae bacterium]|nr:Na+/H+ antiporter subunit E [Hymenobacteraceae bacterium]MDX5397613.1 Na+/H+ antiporter subunit E [Hymenobacteraceae bacterium]MDX5443861.1 Na+/H+ antiporter subunit E [Hymenobacteraceae bacterium]MDX5513693.1 Na+/H+ antiporter subunit E [Hymenobacteraceae bacterium]
MIRTYVIHIILTIVLVSVILNASVLLWSNAFFATVLSVSVYFIFWCLSFFYDKRHFRNVPRIISLILYFFKEMIKANLRIAYDVLTPHYYMHPTIIALPLDAETDLEITLFANLLTLTPGTLSIDITPDRKILYVHSLYVKNGDVEKLKVDLKNGFEKRLLEITR